MDLNDLFFLGMKEYLPDLVEPLEGMPCLNLGAGRHEVVVRGEAAYNLERPYWDALRDPIPHGDGTVGGIFALHFLEHLADPRPILRECMRVLAPGAPLTIVVPHPYGTMAYHDLDHKSTFVIDTWRNLQDTTWQDWDRHGWPFSVGVNVIMGTKERNLVLLTQLIKHKEGLE
jgi:SAM-dependent methyltransferase